MPNISPKNVPAAGEQFEFSVGHSGSSKGPIDITVEIDGREVDRGRCADPPCHRVLRIRFYDAYKALVIRAKTLDGQIDTVELTIGPTKSNPQTSAPSAQF